MVFHLSVLALLWAAYGAMHSLLASLVVKQWVLARWPWARAGVSSALQRSGHHSITANCVVDAGLAWTTAVAMAWVMGLADRSAGCGRWRGNLLDLALL